MGRGKKEPSHNRVNCMFAVGGICFRPLTFVRALQQHGCWFQIQILGELEKHNPLERTIVLLDFIIDTTVLSV